MKVVFVGTGTPTPNKNNFGSCALIDSDKSRILVDCGPAATQKLINAGYSPLDIDSIFLTHLHFDHCVDLPCFLLTYWDQNTDLDKILHIYGPKGTEFFVDKLTGENGAFKDDIAARINAGASIRTYINRGGIEPRPVPDFDVMDIYSGFSIRIDDVDVKAAMTKHVDPWLESYAYRFDFDGRGITFAGDTGSVETISRLAEGSDILVVNCWNADAVVRGTDNIKALATIEDAAVMAKRSGSRKLVLSHLGYRSGQGETMTDDEMIEIAGSIFNGETVIAYEGYEKDL